MASGSNHPPSLNNNKNQTARSVVGSLQSELALKLILLVVLNLWVYLPYQFLQRHHFFPTMIMAPGVFDRMIPFSDQAVWLYLSIYLLMPIGPFLMDNRPQILRYAAGIMMISFLADAVFLFWPTSCPRPDLTGTNAIYRTLVLIDNPFHACPSLHAAFALYSACCGGLVMRALRFHWRWRVGIWLWALLILFATLATKQHVFTDIVAGSAPCIHSLSLCF